MSVSHTSHVSEHVESDVYSVMFIVWFQQQLADDVHCQGCELEI